MRENVSHLWNVECVIILFRIVRSHCRRARCASTLERIGTSISMLYIRIGHTVPNVYACDATRTRDRRSSDNHPPPRATIVPDPATPLAPTRPTGCRSERVLPSPSSPSSSQSQSAAPFVTRRFRRELDFIRSDPFARATGVLQFAAVLSSGVRSYSYRFPKRLPAVPAVPAEPSSRTSRSRARSR